MNLSRLLSRRPVAVALRPLRSLPLLTSGPGRAPARALDVFVAAGGASGVRRSSADLGVMPQNQNTQGTNNACGTTALASLMSYFGVPTTHQQIDASIRPFDFGTGSTDLVAYANAHGMRAQLKDGASLGDLTSMIDKGVPPMVLMDPDGGSNTNLHYVTITGYTRNADGSVKDLLISDTWGATGAAQGQRYSMPAAEFDAKWGNLKLAGISTGESREMICMVPAHGTVVGGDGVTRDAASIELPTSSLRDELRAAPMHLIESTATALGNAAQKVKDELKSAASKVRDFFKSLF